MHGTTIQFECDHCRRLLRAQAGQAKRPDCAAQVGGLEDEQPTGANAQTGHQSDGKVPDEFYADPKDGKGRQILEFARVKP